jgi:hypothetical protein
MLWHKKYFTLTLVAVARGLLAYPFILKAQRLIDISVQQHGQVYKSGWQRPSSHPPDR